MTKDCLETTYTITLSFQFPSFMLSASALLVCIYYIVFYVKSSLIVKRN